MAFDLRAWLRRRPAPRKLRLISDDDDRIVDLGAGRVRWAEVETTVTNAKPQIVECLDAEGAVLRSQRLEDENPDKASPEDKAVAKSQQANAAMLDAYGKRLVEAFNAGAEAAAVSQGNLVSIVETLTKQLTIAITNQLTLAANYANEVARSGGEPDGEGKGSEALMGLLGTMLAGRNLPAPPPPAPPNGGKAK